MAGQSCLQVIDHASQKNAALLCPEPVQGNCASWHCGVSMCKVKLWHAGTKPGASRAGRAQDHAGRHQPGRLRHGPRRGVQLEVGACKARAADFWCLQCACDLECTGHFSMQLTQQCAAARGGREERVRPDV